LLFQKLILFFAGISWAVLIHQTPSVFVDPGDNVSLVCSHNRSDYKVMLWYRLRPKNTALDLIGYGYNEFTKDSVEQSFKESFKLEGDLKARVKKGSLVITNITAEEHT
ncbi:hypothetical protein NQD34_016080, partial [Periophthalmus magnuspinnatus]